MAKASKLEDYWRQNNIESLFKELTHNLAQRMPSDPAVDIVQYLQKKFPKSFKTSADTNSNIGIVPKTMASSLQLQSITSPSSDVNSDNTNDIERLRRASNQSQVSGIVTIPTAQSAFTDLLKKDTNTLRQAPELNLVNLAFANRISQNVVKLEKDIRSDHDILEEELIQPIKKETKVSPTNNELSSHSVAEDHPATQTYVEPSVSQLIERKRQIVTGKNHRHLHRKELADLAKQARKEEQHIQPDQLNKSDGIQQQNQKLDDDPTSSQAVPDKSSSKSINKPIVKSQEEEELLNDENTFHRRGNRNRERDRNKLSTAGSNIPYQRQTRMFSSLKRTDDTNAMPMMQFGVCKVCGNIMNDKENQSIINSQQVSAMPIARSFEPQTSARSGETSDVVVDDWFESASEVSGSRQVSPWPEDAVTPRPMDKNLFQPINDNTQHRPPAVPIITTNDETKNKRSTTPNTSQSGFFVRTPEPKNRPLSSPRSTSSPVTKKYQTDTRTATTHQVLKSMTYPSRSPPVPTSTLTTIPITERRMSGSSVAEYSPDDPDEN